MKTAVIAIGDELLLGQVIDTNSGAIARMIDPAGWSLEWVKVIHDDAEAITSAVDEAFRAADVVLTTGGLGPTKDDITKLTLCRYFGGELRHDETVLDNIKEVFAKRGIQLNPLTEAQALVPTSCRVSAQRPSYGLSAPTAKCSYPCQEYRLRLCRCFNLKYSRNCSRNITATHTSPTVASSSKD